VARDYSVSPSEVCLDVFAASLPAHVVAPVLPAPLHLVNFGVVGFGGGKPEKQPETQTYLDRLATCKAKIVRAVTEKWD
jgi:hypothetical protein